MTTAAESRPRKPKACKHCKTQYIPSRPMQKACSPACALEMVQASRAKAERKAQRADTKARKEKIKTRSDWIKEAQRAFNGYIRARDRDRPCICCGHPLEHDAVGGGFDCGHYRSVGSAPHLRFDERNAHAQRKQCNRYGSGRAVDYRIGLIARIGLAAVEALEADQTPKHYSIEDLKQIKQTYAAKRKEIEQC